MSSLDFTIDLSELKFTGSNHSMMVPDTIEDNGDVQSMDTLDPVLSVLSYCSSETDIEIVPKKRKVFRPFIKVVQAFKTKPHISNFVVNGVSKGPQATEAEVDGLIDDYRQGLSYEVKAAIANIPVNSSTQVEDSTQEEGESEESLWVQENAHLLEAISFEPAPSVPRTIPQLFLPQLKKVVYRPAPTKQVVHSDSQMKTQSTFKAFLHSNPVRSDSGQSDTTKVGSSILSYDAEMASSRSSAASRTSPVTHQKAGKVSTLVNMFETLSV